MAPGLIWISHSSGKHDVDSIAAPSPWSLLEKCFLSRKKGGSNEERCEMRGCVPAAWRYWVKRLMPGN